MVLAVLFPFIAGILVPLFHVPFVDRLFYSRFIYWAEVLLLLLYARKVEGQPLFIWKEHAPDVLFFIGSVILLYLLSIAAGLIAFIPHMLGYVEKNALLKKIAALIQGRFVLIAFIALTAGVTEEIIFRGYLLTRLSLMFKNDYMPVLISAALFSGLHYGFGSVQEFIFTFLIGIIFGVYYLKYRNLKALIVTHFFIDFISMGLLQQVHHK